MRGVISNDINVTLTMGTYKRKQIYNLILIILIICICPEHVMHSIENINLTQIPSLEELELLDNDAEWVCSK